LHPEHSGILFSFSSKAPRAVATVLSSSQADEPAADAMESTPGGTTTTTILRRKVSSEPCWCAAHVLNLIVHEGLKEMSDAIKNIRDSVKYVKSSQARKHRFEKMITEVGISIKKRPPLDVVTRWNITYHMLNCASEYKRAFEALTQEDTQYTHQPLLEEWSMAKKLYNIMRTFSGATEILSGY
jgi:hypothetical protein